MSDQALRIAILGDGLVAELAAVTLAHRLGRGDAIISVGTGRGLDGLGPFGRAVVALPDWQRSPAIAALPPEALVAGTRASFSLGFAFAGWGAGGASWFLPFGDTGAALGSVAFHQLLGRARSGGAAPRLADYSLAAMAAQAERFAFPGDDPRSPLSSLGFAQHFDGDALAANLARLADAVGVRRAEAPFALATRSDQGVAALTLADGTAIEADLFVDCTGTDALLAGEALAVPFESWTRWLPHDRAVTRLEPEPLAPPPYALVGTQPGGWSITVPLAGARATTEVFAHDAPADALPCASGMRRMPWHGNCVAIGASAALVEPLFGTPLMLAQAAIDRLARLLPGAASSGVEAAEFNRIAANTAERARDMAIALHATRGGTVTRADLPDSLARKLDLFASRGSVPEYDDELFAAADWIAMLDGQGLSPRRVDPLAAAISDEGVAAHLTRLRERLVATLRTMPAHGEVLATMGNRR